VRIGGRWGAHPAVAAVGKRAVGVTRTPAFGVAALAPLVLAGAVGGAAPPFHGKSPIPSVHAVITPVAAVSPSVPDLSGPVVIAIDRAPTAFHIAAPALSAPPPPMIVNSPGALGIPMMALSAYRNAEQKMAIAAPGCGVSWNLLAGIGHIESGHAGGGAVDARGTAVVPIYGPALDGTLPGNEVIIQSNVGNRVTYARAMGPMQFLPGTWARYATDGDGDGLADPQNLFDSTLAAARYLCSGGLNLRDPAQVTAAILRYNNSMPYAQNVLGWAAAYATGVVPVDLPPITGPPPPLGDAHDGHPEGLGPGLPMNIYAMNDPLARMPLIDFGPPQVLGPPPMFPWMAPATAPQSQTQLPGCTLICIGQQSPPPGAPQPPAQAFPPGVGPPPPAAVPPGAPPAGLAPAPPAGPPPSDPLAGPAVGPPPGSPPGPAAGARKAAPSPKPAGPPPAAATNPPAPDQPGPIPPG
jgi:membrane-bound lytic murein transglycosylase B